MKYTIPYDDRIGLPKIKRLETIGISADSITYDKKDLAGNIVISGDYTIDGSDDVMEFTHEIPVSFLIDDEKINPEVNIANFKYDVVPGKGLDVRFDFDVILAKAEEDEEEEVINPREAEETEEKEAFQQEIDATLDQVINNQPEIPQEVEVVRDEESKDVCENDDDNHDYDNGYDDDCVFVPQLKPTQSTFDVGFVPKDKDKFCTYKILTLEEGQTVDELLMEHNLSRAALCKVYAFGSNKIIVKVDHE